MQDRQAQVGDNGIDTAAIFEPGVDHWRWLIDSSAYAGYDAVDDI